jgi:hypothetical protein
MVEAMAHIIRTTMPTIKISGLGEPHGSRTTCSRRILGTAAPGRKSYRGSAALATLLGALSMTDRDSKMARFLS